MRTKILVFLGAFVLLLCSAANALAGDFASLNFVGFSRDAKFLAFEEYGTQDGSGYPYSNYYFVDAEKNQFAAPPIQIRIERETATEVQARNKARVAAAAKLRELKIVNGNIGALVVSRLLTDLSANPEGWSINSETANAAETKVRFAREIGSFYQKGDYALTLAPVAAKSAQCDEYGFGASYMFSLTLQDGEKKTSPVVLQKDRELPKSRNCPMRYHIQFVYVNDNKAAIFINSFNPGFEGPDMRYLVVTGKLE